MMTKWLYRKDSKYPFQDWKPFNDQDIVQIKNYLGESTIGPAYDFWWGYEQEFGTIGEGVITKARKLSKSKGESLNDD